MLKTLSVCLVVVLMVATGIFFSSQNIPKSTQTIADTSIATSPGNHNVQPPMTSTFSSSASSSLSGSQNVQLSVGEPTYHNETFVWAGATIGFIGYEVFPLSIYSGTNSSMTLTVTGLPNGTWAHFSPEIVTASAIGSVSQLWVMGAVRPLASTAHQINATIEAKSSSGLSLRASVPLTSNGMSPIVPQDTASDLLPSVLQFPSNYGMPYAVSLVFDPLASSSVSSLEVKLNILGMMTTNSTSIMSLPSWLKIDFSNQSFSLERYTPSFLAIEEQNSLQLQPYIPGLQRPSSTNVTLAVAESINGFVHTQLVNVVIYPPVKL